MELGQKIKLIRKEKKLTQKELGRRIEVSEAAVSQYEAGKRQPDWDTMARLAKTLDVELSYFFDGDKVETTDLLEILSGKKLTWGDQELTEEEKQRALEMMRILLNK